MIRYLASQGIGVLITDHNVRETLDITDRVSIISNGAVLFEGTSDEAIHDAEVRRGVSGRKLRLIDRVSSPLVGRGTARSVVEGLVKPHRRS